MSNLPPTQIAKRKQLMVGVSILLGVVGLATVGVVLTDKSDSTSTVTLKKDVKTKSYIAPGEKVEPQDAWRGVADERLTVMESNMRRLETENRILSDQLKVGKGGAATVVAKSPEASTTKSPEAMSDDDLDKRLKEYEKTAKAPAGYPPNTPSNPVAGAPLPASTRPAGGVAQAKGATQQAATNGMLTVKLRATPTGTPVHAGSGTSAATGPAAGAKDKQPKTVESYFPSGMFGQAVILSGLDAPTGGQAQQNPHPLLLLLSNPANLPNGHQYDWQQCHITAAGYGDISSERAYIRTESISCVSKDGRVMDAPLKGYLSGEDGKAGVRGRLVSKQGQALANALLAGVVSGIGSGIEKSSTVQSVSPLGATTTVKPGAEFRAGMAEGVGKGLDRLSNYYIQLAEKLFPVIEVDAGRVVDVILTKGVSIDVDVSQQ